MMHILMLTVFVYFGDGRQAQGISMQVETCEEHLIQPVAEQLATEAMKGHGAAGWGAVCMGFEVKAPGAPA